MHRVWPGSATVGAAKEPAALTVKRAASLQIFFYVVLLQRLDLSSYRFAGGVSPDFNRLQRLASLYLENNSLNGTLPSNLDLPKLQLFNVSRNNLTGPHVSRNSLASLLSRSPWRAWTRRLSLAGRGLGWLAAMYG